MTNLNLAEEASPTSSQGHSDARGRVPSPMSRGARWAAWTGLVVLQLAHLMARDAGWEVDLRWASSQYLFSLLLFGPLVAGISAHQGRGVAQVAWVVRAAPLRSVVDWWRAPLGIAVAVFLTGWFAVELVALNAGATWNLTIATAGNVLSALLGLAAYSATGFAIGVAWPRRLTPAVAMLATFAVTMIGWAGLLPSLVWFGGAPAGVTGTELDPTATLARSLFAAAVLVLALVAAVRLLGSARASWVALMPAAAMVAAVLLASTTQPVRAQPIAWSCVGQEPAVCVSVEFTRFLPAITAGLDSSGVAEAVAASSDRTSRAMHIDDDLLLAEIQRNGAASPGARDRLGYAVSDTLIAPGCFPVEDRPILDEDESAVAAALSAWIDYMSLDQATLAAYGITTAADYGAPDFPPGSSEAKGFLAERLAALPACP